MTRSRLTSCIACAAMATGLMALGMPAWTQSPAAAASAPPAVTGPGTTPAPSPSGSPATRPRPILGGLLKTAAGERVIDDAVAVYAARGVQGLQAAIRSAANPVGGYRAQLLGKGWKLTVDEPTRLAGRNKNAWITLTATDLHSLTASLPWATVLAYAQLPAETDKAAAP